MTIEEPTWLISRYSRKRLNGRETAREVETQETGWGDEALLTKTRLAPWKLLRNSIIRSARSRVRRINDAMSVVPFWSFKAAFFNGKLIYLVQLVREYPSIAKIFVAARRNVARNYDFYQNRITSHDEGFRARMPTFDRSNRIDRHVTP